MTARSAVLRLSQPALLEPCARGSSGQQDKAPVGRVHLRQVSRPLKASKGQGYHISYLVIGALLLASAGDASAARTTRDPSDKASVGRAHLRQDLLAPKGLQNLNRPRGPPRSMSDPIGLSEMNLPLRL